MLLVVHSITFSLYSVDGKTLGMANEVLLGDTW